MYLFVIIFVIVVYFYITRNHDYWAKRNIKHDPPVPLFGNHYRNVFAIKNISEITQEYYDKYPDEKVVGYYRGPTPELIVKDLEIIRNIMTVDFASFYIRGLGRNPIKEPFLANLFHADDDTWKLLRQRLTPAFTTAKLKNMFPLIVNCAEKLQSVGKEVVAQGGECDMRELMARFTTEFIGACGFGIEMDTINNEHSQFRELGKQIFSRSWDEILLFGLWQFFPVLRNYIRVTKPALNETITNLVQKICEQRDGKPIGRNDFIDLLLELKLKGTIKGESMTYKNQDGTPAVVEMDMDLKCMAAQAFVFFAAGFETSSSATSFTLHQLAFHQEIQHKIQQEIDQVLIKYNNRLCYDAITEFTLLDMAFKESLRMFPSLPVLNRVCAKRYTIPGLDITIDPGVKVIIPIKAIQNDEKYFDNPSEYRPERFSPEFGGDRHKFSYIPFGEGPRACIGARLGQMQSLAGLAAVLQKFTVEPSPLTRRHLEEDPIQNIVQGVRGGIPLRLRERNPTASS